MSYSVEEQEPQEGLNPSVGSDQVKALVRNVGPTEFGESLEDIDMKEFAIIADDVNIEAKRVKGEIRAILTNDPSRRISQDRQNNIMSLVGNLTRTITDMAIKKAYLAGLMEGMSRGSENISEKLEWQSLNLVRKTKKDQRGDKKESDGSN